MKNKTSGILKEKRIKERDVMLNMTNFISIYGHKYWYRDPKTGDLILTNEK